MTGSTLRLLRRLHLYLGVFFAPAIVFFAVSGVLQTFGLHEAHGSPAWIRTMANLHQHQRLHRPERPGRAAPAAGAADPDHADHDDHGHPQAAVPAGGHAEAKPAYTVGMAALKIFTGLMGLALAAASLLGIAVALGTRSTRRVSGVMLALGLVLPIALVFA